MNVCIFIYTFTVYIRELNRPEFFSFATFNVSLQFLKSVELLHLQIYEPHFVELFYSGDFTIDIMHSCTLWRNIPRFICFLYENSFIEFKSQFII